MIPEDVMKLAAKAWVEAWENHQGDMFEPIQPSRRRTPCGAADNEECAA